MKKKLIILLVALGITNILTAKADKKKDCYIPKGELTCVTDLSTEEGVRKALESMKRKDGLYEEAKVHFDKGRFGNRYVGFIAYPKGKWVIFHDPDSSPVAFQIARGTDIYTLDVLRIENKEGKTDSQIVSEIINTLYRGYREAGHPDSNLVKKNVTVNGYKGGQLKVKEISGKSLVTNIVVSGDKIYFASAEAIPSHIEEMKKWILNSWNQYK